MASECGPIADFVFLQLVDVLQLIFVVFAGAALIQGLYYLLFFSRFAFQKAEGEGEQDEPLEPVSVVICAKNEADNLLENLPLHYFSKGIYTTPFVSKNSVSKYSASGII